MISLKYKEIILLKLGEMVLKGLNRSSFEQQLLNNVRYRLSAFGKYKVSSLQSTVYIRPLDEDAEMHIDEATKAMQLVYGIVVVSKAAEVAKDMDVILKAVPDYCNFELSLAKTFRVLVKRIDKDFPLTSPEIGALAGEACLDVFPDLKVKLEKPELTVYVEIRDTAAYIHAGRLPGAGGMPVGTGGKGLLLLSGGIDSPAAGHMLAKRGVRLTAVHFESPPYTSERAKQKVLDLAETMSHRCGRIKLYFVNAAPIMEALRDNCREEYFTLLLRRMMMRIACRIAEKEDCECLITGESLGQVASQTMKSLASTSEVCDRMIFRPLIGMDKEEIIQIARATDTFEISSRPFEDCCTVFTPKHPNTKPTLKSIHFEEDRFDFEPYLEKALNEAEYIFTGTPNAKQI